MGLVSWAACKSQRIYAKVAKHLGNEFKEFFANVEKNTFDKIMELADEADSPLGQDTFVPRNLSLNWIVGFQ